MPMCCSKKAAMRQKEYEEEVRMRKLEEVARLEQEQREENDRRKAEIERLMLEEKQAQAMQKLAQEEKERAAMEEAEQERIRMEQEEAERIQQEKMMGSDMMTMTDGKIRTISARSSMDTTGSFDGDAEKADDSFDMQTYTPFDMATIDQTARYMASKCGCALKSAHRPVDCPICQGIDLSDAPLIA